MMSGKIYYKIANVTRQSGVRKKDIRTQHLVVLKKGSRTTRTFLHYASSFRTDDETEESSKLLYFLCPARRRAFLEKEFKIPFSYDLRLWFRHAEILRYVLERSAHSTCAASNVGSFLTSRDCVYALLRISICKSLHLVTRKAVTTQ